MITLFKCKCPYIIDAYDSIYPVHMITIINADTRNKKRNMRILKAEKSPANLENLKNAKPENKSEKQNDN